jgi:hypothetical protein
VPLSKVYSTRFFSVKGLTGTQTYSVPVGNTAVIRSIQMYINSTGNAGLTLRGDKGQAVFKATVGVNTEKMFVQELRSVVLQGETMELVADVGAFDAWDATVSGYLLSNT